MYKTLLQLASDNEELELLSLDRSDVEKWVHEWDVPSEDKSNFLQLVAAAFAKSGQPCVCFDLLALIDSGTDWRAHTNQSDCVRIHAFLRSIPARQFQRVSDRCS